ncbi:MULTISPECIES: hypothetical protein [Pseudomonas syringae group]|uniref:Uncharacterized protein n=1 Tax=Pseudomonas cichorii TaxID=36746 RepID=A0A3M4VR73_PSECI|nr:hypothetical protein [Pseudomonas cichorii]AHF68282.1 hypothetical protein PCH70_31290 [Pseudomonas cichorii JBC1]QVE15311.1 hypothetical protein KGD89_15535 [Pseudomonas cichorii]RMR54346.1 hypothetical protein ALP84_01562 [Pseudomonas cichorii]SDP29968.1 hypothetical protein SAMN05216599_1373 [Pseudomonas cichorii]GFM76011.1 hypothetical protein PSCICM_18300 [Pseudomonas cichorii]
MKTFNDKSINQGTRKHTEYLNDQRARLALQVPRTDGGVLHIPLLPDALSTREEESIQRNTLLSVLPLARLPGYDQPNEYPRGGLPRRGRIYVFWRDVLWRELETDGQGQLFEVDVAHWRAVAQQLGNADKRDPVAVKQQVILLPMLLQGRFVADQLRMAYSELPWSWEYIQWLESDASRIKARCQPIARIWDTAVAGSKQWTTTQDNPSLPVSFIRKGMRARDFNIESAMEDPLDFTPEFAAFSDETLLKRLQRRQEQLAQHLKQQPPAPLPEMEAGVDLLDTYKLRDNTHLVALILEDPLFAVRHATAQIRNCVSYLQTLNALIAFQPHGQYAQVLYSAVGGEYAHLKGRIDLPRFHETVFEQERKSGRKSLAMHMARLVHVLDRKLPAVLMDWTYRHDEALLEPYSLMTDALGALEYTPAQADALWIEKDITALETSIRALVANILQADHPLGTMLLATDTGQPPELLKRLIALRDRNEAPQPEAMGLSTLMLSASFAEKVDWPGIGKTFAYFMGDLLDIFGASVVAQLSRLSNSSIKIKLDRLFTPTFNTLSTLSTKMAGIRLMPMGEALAGNYVVIGVQGPGLRRGLTDSERSELTRKNYRYATLHSHSGENLGSTSAKGQGKNAPMLRNVTVLALPEGHPELARYSNFRVNFGALTQGMEKTKVVPTSMVGFAVFNLMVQIEAIEEFKASEESFRGIFGAGSALADLVAALGGHSKLLFGKTIQNYLTKPRINVAEISSRWAKNLEKQTGSPKLPLLRAFGGIATLLSATTSAWDVYRNYRDSNYALSASYAAITAGNLIWLAYTIGLTINPIALLIGAALVIGGAVLANIFADDAIEFAVRYGPLGTDSAAEDSPKEFLHLKDPLIAYQQLTGLLSEPKINAMRLGDWRRKAPTHHLEALLNADEQRKRPTNTHMQTITPNAQVLDDQDWVVTLSTPLLGMLSNSPQHFQLLAHEFQSNMETGMAFTGQHYHWQTAGNPKLAAVPLDTTTVLYVLPSFIETTFPISRTVRTEGLKISTQIELHAEPGSPPLLLPQPHPKKWKPFMPAHRRAPNGNPESSPPLYWQIETIEHRI